jgi:hypothetical protein
MIFEKTLAMRRNVPAAHPRRRYRAATALPRACAILSVPPPTLPT